MSASEAQFEPDTGNPLYAGKSFVHRSGSSLVSSHAEAVAIPFYGGGTSLVAGNCGIDLYLADSWIGSGFLRTGGGMAPSTEGRAVQNHSWIGLEESADEAEEIGRRLDFAINRDGFSCVVGVNNGTSTSLPLILCQSYHSISVGLVNGNHSAGLTTLDGSGRIKPDLVAPADYTSFSTPMVASAAALLHAKLTATPHSLTGADRPRVIKALLLASATKDTVASWSNSETRPLDARFGAGELNIHHAYADLQAGRATPSSNADAGCRGWSAETLPAAATQTYFFTVPAGPPTPFCAALTWHRTVTSSRVGPSLSWAASLPDLNLRLCQAAGFTLGAPIATSASTVDNVELVAAPSLAPGRYALVVENASAVATPHALAWHLLPAVSISASQPIARRGDGQAATVILRRSGDSAMPLWVPLTTAGDADAGIDFTALPAGVTIPAGQSELQLPVIPVSEAPPRGSRQLQFGIGADFALVREPTATAVVSIEDRPFDDWRFHQFSAEDLANPSVSAATADPDGDQLPNLLEYALGTAPLGANPNPVTVAVVDGRLTLQAAKNPAATDLEWSAEVSGDLVQWQPAEILTDTASTFSARAPEDGPGRFIRLKVTRP